MDFNNAGRRCAVNFNELNLPIKTAEAITILGAKGYYKIDVTFASVVNVLREYIGISRYHRGALMKSAPAEFDCSTLTKWAYKLRGIKIPRYSIDQHMFFPIDVRISDMRAGDLVFTTGPRNYFDMDPNYGIGHVGYATNDGTVIHAANSKLGVMESTLGEFIKEFRGVKRLILDESEITTIESTSHAIVEHSTEFRWKILQQCKY